MAKTGSIVIAQGTQEVANNRTYITVTGKITTSGESWRGDSRTGTIVVKQGSKTIYDDDFTHGAPANSTTTLFTIGLWVYHDDKGASGKISASYNYDGGWCSASTEKTLTDIPRKATISSAPNFNDEENPKITYSNLAGDVVTSLQACISLTGEKDDVPYRDLSKKGTSYTFELTEDERKTLRLATTGSNSRTVIFFIRTVIAGQTYHHTLERNFTIINGQPTLEPSVIDVNEKTIALTGDENILIRNFSNAQVESGAQVYKDATIKSQKIICGSKNLSSGYGVISNVGSGSFIFSITDNRENTVSEPVNVPFVEYVNLTCNLNANPPDAEGDVTFSVDGNYFAGSFGSVDNAIEVYYRYKAGFEEYGDWIRVEDIVTNAEDNTYVANISLSGLDYRTKYTFQAMSVDALIEIESVEKVVKTVPVFDWGENDFNFNVPVNVEGDISIKGNVIFDYIIEQGVSGIWTYTKWNSGKVELRARTAVTCAVSTQMATNSYRSEIQSISLPFTVYETTPIITCLDHNSWATGSYISSTSNVIGVVIMRGNSYQSYGWNLSIVVKGRWKE